MLVAKVTPSPGDFGHLTVSQLDGAKCAKKEWVLFYFIEWALPQIFCPEFWKSTLNDFFYTPYQKWPKVTPDDGTYV